MNSASNQNASSAVTANTIAIRRTTNAVAGWPIHVEMRRPLPPIQVNGLNAVLTAPPAQVIGARIFLNTALIDNT